MSRNILVVAVVLALVSGSLAAPVKSDGDTITDRKGYIPNRKHQALPGKVVGILLPDAQSILAAEGRSGPANQLCFGLNGCSYRWVYVPVQNNPLVRSMNIRIGNGLEVKKFDNLSLASAETVKQWDIPGTYALVEIEVNGGLGSPADDSFVATKMTRLDGTADMPFKVNEVISELKRKYDDQLREKAGPVDDAMTKAGADALKGRRATGPRERVELMFVTWMPETERLRVHFRTTITDGEYQYANGIKIELQPTTRAAPDAPGTITTNSNLPNGLRFGKQFGVEFGTAFDVSKSGKIEKTLTLPLESFQRDISAPPTRPLPRPGPVPTKPARG